MTRSAFLFLFAVAATAQTRADLPPDTLREVERTISAEMSRAGAPGASVATVLDGMVRYANGFGLAELENSVPATADTVYRLASISKPVTATAVMQLVEQGKIDLDAPVERYVPGFPKKEWTVTIRQLLGHLGGIRHYQADEMRSTRHYADVLEPLHIFKDDPLIAEPGTRYSYTTYGYNLLGAAVEGASGEKFPDYLNRHVFEPAGMDRIRVDSAFEIIPRRAQGYFRRPGGSLENSIMVDTSNKIPGGGLCSTVHDLARFAAAIMAGRLVRRETFEMMSTRQRTRDGKTTGYGFGFGLEEHDGFRYVMHGGGQPRVSTMLAMIPDRNFAVVWMCNLEGSRLRIHRELPKLLLR
jgi:CubicO group peptidase (beta-lactamase class C family)